MKSCFENLTELLDTLLQPDEVYTCYFLGEDSDFVRMNKGLIRQAGHVRQRELRLDLIEGKRHATGVLGLTENRDQDRRRLRGLVETLRAQRRHLEEDPHLLYAETVENSEDITEPVLPDGASAVEAVLDAAAGMDLVGIWASGPLYAGFANSLGQRNWYRTACFNLDWSCYYGGDKAVKAGYAGKSWRPEELDRRMAQVRSQLELVRRLPKTVQPGRYRAYLAPTALREFLDMMAWGGFGLRSHRTAQTPLIKMINGGARLHPAVTLVENRGGGLVPRFTAEGFLPPERVDLIDRGEYRNALAGPRSSREYGVPVNAGTEIPQSLDMLPGDIPQRQVLDRLGTGVLLNNLWYSNFSDHNECRITAMTRFACFWVEHSEIVAPLNVMRLDDSIYRVLGDRLVGLTREREFLADPGTYERRSLASIRLPGALVEDFTFTS